MLVNVGRPQLEAEALQFISMHLGFKPQWGEIFQTHADQPQDQPNPLYNGYQVFFSGIRQPGHGIDQPSRAEVKYWHSYTSTSPLCLLGMLQDSLQPVPLPWLHTGIRSPSSCSCKNLSASYGPFIFGIMKVFRIVRSKRWKSGLLDRKHSYS